MRSHHALDLLYIDEPLDVVAQKNAGVFDHDADSPDHHKIPDHGSTARSDPERAGVLSLTPV